MIAFYTHDADQIDRWFRRSKLFGENWQRQAYRLTTIHDAIKFAQASRSQKPTIDVPLVESPHPRTPTWDLTTPNALDSQSYSTPQLSRARGTLHRMAAAQAVLAPLCHAEAVTFPPRLETVQALQLLWQER